MDFPSSFTAGNMSHRTFMWKAMVVWPNSTGTERNSCKLKSRYKANDIKKIKKMVDDNADIILKRCKEYFDKD